MPMGDQPQASSAPPQGGASPSTLAGQGGGDDPQQGVSPQAQPNPDEGLKQAVQIIRQTQSAVMDLARQFPAAASALRQVETGLRAALRQIVANPGTPEPPSPAIGG